MPPPPADRRQARRLSFFWAAPECVEEQDKALAGAAALDEFAHGDRDDFETPSDELMAEARAAGRH